MALTSKTTSAATMEDAHRLLDELPASQAGSVVRYLESVRDGRIDPLLQKLLNAPLDDEPETAEEKAAVEEARQEFENGQGIPHDEIIRELSQ